MDEKLAATYHPSINGLTKLHVQRLPVKGVVELDGSYKVYAGEQMITQGKFWKDVSTEGMMNVFIQEALMWSQRVDEERTKQAELDREAAEQHMAETSDGLNPIELVQALGGRFRIDSPSRSFFIDNAAMVAVLANAARYGVVVDILSDTFDDHMLLQLNDGNGKVYGEYHYDGR